MCSVISVVNLMPIQRIEDHRKCGVRLAAMLRMAARSLVSRGSGPSEVLTLSRPYLGAALMLIFGALPPLIVLSLSLIVRRRPVRV